MITRAVLCPSPPLLARELTGRADVLPELRDACATAVARLLAARPALVTVVGAGDATRAWPPDSRLDLRSYAPGLRGEGPAGTPGLPLALGLGALLLDEAGYRGPRALRAIAGNAPATECLREGASCTDSAGRAGLLVIGDGSARRSPTAPGALDERAAPFDASVERAVGDGDMAALAALDRRLAAELMATGRAAWQVLAGALDTTTPVTGEILYSGAPFGVGYLVGVLDISTARAD